MEVCVLFRRKLYLISVSGGREKIVVSAKNVEQAKRIVQLETGKTIYWIRKLKVNDCLPKDVMLLNKYGECMCDEGF